MQILPGSMGDPTVRGSHTKDIGRLTACSDWMPTTKKRPKSGFALGISNTSRRLLFPDQNDLNFQT